MTCAENGFAAALGEFSFAPCEWSKSFSRCHSKVGVLDFPAKQWNKKNNMKNIEKEHISYICWVSSEFGMLSVERGVEPWAKMPSHSIMLKGIPSRATLQSEIFDYDGQVS